ncbi:Tetratricopeptide repeat-containing protein [Hirschfeldia incana]|nr:Tetratricopeptide repeat-containing protein [Hirschfeldia incana]
MLKSEASLSSYYESGYGLKPENPVTGIEDSQTEQGDEEGVIKKIDGGRGEVDKFDLYGKEIKFDLPSFNDESCGDYYKRMLEEYPSHPLLLKNYASFLEYKGDLNGAKEYYHQCTVVEPSDGVALANYGRLVMQLHQDKAKASSYFERAVKASPNDSNVLAAYASFLWQIDAEDDDDEDGDYFEGSTRPGKEDSEPKTAGEHSSRLSETEDGETLCRYAKSFWSIKGDHDKALFYFEKAIEASPQDSIILGEYARFLWEMEE